MEANTMMNSMRHDENGFNMRTINLENLGHFFCNNSPIINGGNKETAYVAICVYGTTIAPLSKIILPNVNVHNGITTAMIKFPNILLTCGG